MDMNMFKNEDELIQAEACYDTAMERIGREFPDVSSDTYADRVWFAVAGEVTRNGYDKAMEYAKTAYIHV